MAKFATTRPESATTSRLLLRDLNVELLNELLAEWPVTNAVAPYEVQPAALANVRARLASGRGGN